MLELAQNLILNEDALNSLPEGKRPVFIYEWLGFLNKVLITAQENDIRESQSRMVEQLLEQIQYEPGPPIRTLIGRNLATLFSIGDSFLLLNTINRCNDILKSKDEIAKLSAVGIIGALYERLGRVIGRSYEETVQLLLQTLKNADSQMCFEILFALERIVNGVGSAGGNIHRDIFKVARTHMCDRAMPVRSAAAMCLIALINQNNFMYTSELEENITLGFRAFIDSNYEVRCSIAKYLAVLLAVSRNISSKTNQNSMSKSNTSITSITKIKADDMLNYLAAGFLRGSLGLLKSNTAERLKQATLVQCEMRIGITHTYVELIRILGTTWIEQNLSLFINHVLELVGNPQTSTSDVDAAYSCECITFILRSVIGLRLGEKAQFAAAKVLTIILARYTTPQSIINSSSILTNDSTISLLHSSTNSVIQSYDSLTINHSESTNIEYVQHILICTLHELSLLVQSFGTSASLLLQDSCNGFIDTLFLVLCSPSHSVRLLAAWCLRSITTASPSLMTPLIDKCLEKMSIPAKESISYNVDTMSGFALALQALLGAVYRCPLGISSKRAKTIFAFADELLRTTIVSTAAQQQSHIPRTILQRTHTAWHLLAACCTLGSQFIKQIKARLVVLWRNVFPRSQSDFEQEKQHGDSFTWILSFNQRSDALCSMISFFKNCSTSEENLINDDLFKRMLNPIENAIIILFHIPNLVKQFGHQLKGATTMFRLRLYELLLLIPMKFYEQYLKALLKEIVAELTLTDNSSNTTTSLLRLVCHDNDSILLGNGLQETEYQMIEKLLEPNSSSGFCALEHDDTYLYHRDSSLSPFNIIYYLSHSLSLPKDTNSRNTYYFHPTKLNIPESLPLDIAVIDASILLYSTMFIRVANKHRLNMLQHFIDIIKHSKGARQEAVQINIFTAVLMSLKTLAETKQSLSTDDEKIKKCTYTLVMQTLRHSNPLLRCAAGEALGRLVEIVGDERFVADIAQYCCDHIKEFRDIPSRTGYSLALGCLHRYVGSMNTGKYLNLSVSVLLALAQDQSASIVQVWTLHALALIADCEKQIFRSYVEPSLTLISHLLLSISPSQTDVFRCCGRLLGALIIIIGPELQLDTNDMSILRSSCLTASNLLQMHIEPIVQVEAIQALQQLHAFTPQHVNLATLLPELIKAFKSQDLSLRSACVSCLRHLSQREAKKVSEHAKIFMRNVTQDVSSSLAEFRSLEETDIKLCSNIQDTLACMLQAAGVAHLTHWLQLCKDILVVTPETSNTVISSFEIDHQTTNSPKSSTNSNRNGDADKNSDYADTGGDEKSQTTTDQNLIRHSASSAKWQTKVFAIDCVQKLINYCEQTTQSNLHFDYISANERLRTYPNEDYLVIHLNTLITLSFMASTSTHDQLRLSGLSLLKQIILKFTHIEDDIDLPGVHQLLVSSLQKFTSVQQLQHKNDTNMIYSETALTTENLVVLKTWADVYNIAAIRQKENRNCNLLILIQTEINVLIHYWLAVLTDYAFLTLPDDFGGTNDKSNGGNFYSTESNIDLIRTIYKSNWASIVKATTQWLAEHHYELETLSTNERRIFPERKEDIFAMLLGCCVEALSISISEQTDETIEAVLSSFINLLQSDLAKSQMTMFICIELINVLRRLYFVRTDIKTHLRILKILEKIFHLIPSCIPIMSVATDDHSIPGEPFLFPSLELLVCILLCYHPNVTDDLQLGPLFQIRLATKSNSDNHQITELLLSNIKLLSELITLCTTDEGHQALISVILHVLLSLSYVFLSTKSEQQKSVLLTISQLIENIFSKKIQKSILRCAMVRMINLQNNLIQKGISDNGHFVRCLTSLIMNSTSIELTDQCLDFYRKSLNNQEIHTHQDVLQCLHQLFQCSNVHIRNRFIRIFTPLLLNELKELNNNQQKQTIEILKIFETLLSIVDPTLRILLASSIIPVFIHFLPNSTSSNLETNTHLISYIIERIQYLMTIYSDQFRLILQTLPDLRTKLENVIRRQ